MAEKAEQKIWASFDDNGRVNGFFLGELFPDGRGVADGARVITREQYEALMAAPNAWRWDGMGLAPHVEEPSITVPISVPRWQGKIAVIRAGLMPQVMAIATADASGETMVFLNDTVTWERASPTIASFAELLSLSAEQVDDLFVAASQIVI